jgi:hypothetical protein
MPQAKEEEVEQPATPMSKLPSIRAALLEEEVAILSAILMS